MKWRFAITVACLSINTALAGEVERFTSDLATITNSKGEGRILFHLDVEALPQYARVERATLEVSLTGPIGEKGLVLQIHPVTTPWAAGSVDWNSGWQKPGGDFDVGAYTRAEIDLSKGSATFGIDLTGMMKEILEDGRAANGFIVTVPSYAGEGIPSSDLSWLAGFSSATLDLSYRIYSRPPPWLGQDAN